jgi:hypothetical protein
MTRKLEDYSKPGVTARKTGARVEAKCLCCHNVFLSIDKRSNRICAACKDQDGGSDYALGLDVIASDSLTAGGVCGGGRQRAAYAGLS